MARAKGESLERSSVRSLPVPAAVHPGGKSYVLYGLYAQLLRACRGHITSNEAGELQAQADRGLSISPAFTKKAIKKAYKRRTIVRTKAFPYTSGRANCTLCTPVATEPVQNQRSSVHWSALGDSQWKAKFEGGRAKEKSRSGARSRQCVRPNTNASMTSQPKEYG